jgi:hypothetical protein
MFRRRKHADPDQHAAAAGSGAGTADGRADSGMASTGTVPALALLCDAYINFDSDEALRGFAASVLRSRSPQLDVGANAPVEAATGFSGSDDQARAELIRLLGRAMSTAGADPQRYELMFFTARSEMPPAKVWCLAPTKPVPAPTTAAPPPTPGAEVISRAGEITARLKDIDVQLETLRSRMGAAVNASSDAPGANVLIASIEQMLGRASPTDTPTLGQVQALEHERDELRAELAAAQQSQ